MVTQKRIQEIQDAALRIVAEYGIENLDKLPLETRTVVVADMRRRLMTETGCVAETARKRIAWAIRRLRDPHTPPTVDARGGRRPGAGRPTRVEQLFREWGEETGLGEVIVSDGEKVAVFYDEDPVEERIPISDLGYNSELGFFRKSQFPDVESL